jgi:hypothetical protein
LVFGVPLRDSVASDLKVANCDLREAWTSREPGRRFRAGLARSGLRHRLSPAPIQTSIGYGLAATLLIIGIELDRRPPKKWEWPRLRAARARLCAHGALPCATRIRRQAVFNPWGAPSERRALYLHPCGRSTWETMRSDA